jgi:hypothetical protein
MDSNRDSYSIYFDIENKNFEIDTDRSFLSELKSAFYSYQTSSYMNNATKSDDNRHTCMILILIIVGIITLLVALTVIFVLY